MAQAGLRRFQGQRAFQAASRSISVVRPLALSGSFAGVLGILPIEFGNDIIGQPIESSHDYRTAFSLLFFQMSHHSYASVEELHAHRTTCCIDEIASAAPHTMH